MCTETIYKKKDMKKKEWKPRRIRDDIINNLPFGAQKEIATNNNVGKSYVNAVLNGRKKDTKNIIRDAELLAAINIWKTRFCKYPSKI